MCRVPGDERVGEGDREKAAVLERALADGGDRWRTQRPQTRAAGEGVFAHRDNAVRCDPGEACAAFEAAAAMCVTPNGTTADRRERRQGGGLARPVAVAAAASVAAAARWRVSLPRPGQ